MQKKTRKSETNKIFKKKKPKQQKKSYGNFFSHLLLVAGQILNDISEFVDVVVGFTRNGHNLGKIKRSRVKF